MRAAATRFGPSMLAFQPTPFGDYILQDRIGAGGMAEIFLATARGIEGFEKRLVIKRILPTLSDDEQFVRMFVEEAKLCVSLHHPNIVQVYDLGLIDGQYFIAMEYVDGRDLLKTLAACGRQKRGFPTDIALYIVMEVLKGLDYAHGLTKDGEPLGIIHRDVSPSNVLLSFEGEVKLGDFGIAKARTRERTATGILKGKFGYMAPEQVAGVPIDYRADIFAVGILLYELLTGHRLFAGKNDLAVLERVRKAQITPPPRHYRQDLDYELEHIVMKALARDPSQRFGGCMELHDAIHDYVFRSRATVGPPQLALFMQKLFLHDEEELARRLRLRLPPILGGPEPAFGVEDTADDRSDAASEQLKELTDEDLSARRASSITDGREVFDAPLIANQRPATPPPGRRAASPPEGGAARLGSSGLDVVSALRRARQGEHPTEPPSSPRALGPGMPRRRSRVSSGGRDAPGFAPAEIVERAASATDREEYELVSAPRYDSDPALPPLETRRLAGNEATQTTAPPGPEPRLERYRALQNEPSDFKTVEVEDGELPTAEVEGLSPPIDAPPAQADRPAATKTVDELDQTVLGPDQQEVIQQVLASAHGPAEPTGVDMLRSDTIDDPTRPEARDPADEPFAERTIASAGPPDLALDEASLPDPISAEAETEWGDAEGDVPATRPDEDEWSDKTVAHPEAVDEAPGTSATEPSDVATLKGRVEDTRDLAVLEDAPPETADIPFDGDADEESVPAITDEGRLGDAGASGLFGALSVLDQPPQLEVDADDDQRSVDTVGRFYADFSESMGRGGLGADARSPSELARSDEFGETRMGVLADPLDEVQPLPSFALHAEAPTESVSDGQVMSISQEVQSALPEPEAYSLVQARPSSVAALQFVDDGDDREPSFSTVNEAGEPHVRGVDIPLDPADPAADVQSQDTPLAALDSGLQWPSDERADGPGLISQSFELPFEPPGGRGPAPAARGRTPSRARGPGDAAPPVRPVSMVRAPGGVEDTPSQGGYALPPIARATPRGPEALRAVVGRKGRIRELNRAQRGAPAPEPQSARPEPPAASRGTPPRTDQTPPLPSRGTPPRGGRAARAVPSNGLWSTGTPSAPPAMVIHRPRATWLTVAMYGLPLLAVLLTVAALVSSVVLRGRGSQPPPDGRVGRIILVPDDAVSEPPASLGPSGPASPTPPTVPEPPPLAPPEAPPDRAPPPLGATDADGAASRVTPAPEAPQPTPAPKQKRGKKAGARRGRRAKLGLIRVRCAQPTIVRIAGVGAYRAAPQVARRLKPGDYQVKLSRGGKVLTKVVIPLVAGDSVKVPCP